MVRRVIHYLLIGIISLSGCSTDNGAKVCISAETVQDCSNGKGQCLRVCTDPDLSYFEVRDRTKPSSNLPKEWMLPREIPAVESMELWENSYGSGLRLTTAHYRIFTTILEPEILRRIPAFMESAYQAYRTQLIEAVEPQTGLTTYLFANRRQWEEFTKDFTGDQARTFCRIKAGAYYHNGSCVAYDIGPERTLAVLGHEGWHQFSDKHFKFRLPSWIDEGIAMLFETSDAESGKFQLAPAQNAYRLSSLKKTLENNSMIPLRELISSNPGDVLATDRTEAVMAFYSQAYALVRFLQEADSGRRKKAYDRLLVDGLRGRWRLDGKNMRIAVDRSIPRNILWNHVVGLVLFEDYVGDDYDRIEKEYLTFCRQIVN